MCFNNFTNEEKMDFLFTNNIGLLQEYEGLIQLFYDNTGDEFLMDFKTPNGDRKDFEEIVYLENENRFKIIYSELGSNYEIYLTPVEINMIDKDMVKNKISNWKV